MRINTGLGIGVVGVLLVAFATHRPTPPAPALTEVLDLPEGPVRLVVFQPADCELRRRAIVREIVEKGAVPIVLYADAIESADLGRLLGEGVSEVEVRRLPDVGLEATFRSWGVRSTPFALILDERGVIERVVTDIGGADS